MTGSTRRGGAAIARALHARGLNVVIHHASARSRPEAEALAAELLAARAGSVRLWQASFTEPALPLEGLEGLALSVLVCNASVYQPSTLADTQARDRDLSTHLLAHAALAKHCRASLRALVAVSDIHVDQPHQGHVWYHVAKAALESLVFTLAVEWAPEVRCNVVAPGALPFPEAGIEAERVNEVLRGIPLARTGSFEELAAAVVWLALDASYVTGQKIKLDGGRSRWLR